MMSPSQISAAIRAKKKLLKEGSEDAQDVMDAKNDEAGEALSENMPKEMDDGAPPSPDMEMDEEKKAQKAARMEKVRLMMKGAKK